MKVQLRNSGNEVHTFSNRNLRRIYLEIHGIQDVANTAPATTNIDLSKIRVSLDVKQAGTSASTSFNAIAPTVAGALHYNYPSITQLNFSSGGVTLAGQTVVVAASGVYAETITIVPLVFDPFILKGQDEMKVNIDLNTGLFEAALDGSSKVYLVTEDGTDLNQVDISLPIYTPLTNEKSQVSFSYPAVNKLSLIDSGGTDSRSDIPFTSVEIKSNHFNDRFDTIDLVSRQLLDSRVPFADNNNNFKIVDITPSSLVDVTVNIAVDTTLITANNQFLFANSVIYNRALASRSVSLAQKVNAKKAAYRGFGNI